MDFAKIERPSMSPECVGAAFHEALHGIFPEEVHPDDAQHNHAVGEALLSLQCGVAPMSIVTAYNGWARTHGYAEIRFLGWWLDALGKLWIVGDFQMSSLIGIRVNPSGHMDVQRMEQVLCR